MSEQPQEPQIDLGIFGGKGAARGLGPTDIIAISLSLLWLIASIGFFLILGQTGGESNFDPIVFVMTLLAVTMPVALIWVGASAAKSAKIMREESRRLQAAIDAMRHSYLEQQRNASMNVRPSVEKKLDEIAQTARQTESTVATFASIRSAKPTPAIAAPASPIMMTGDDQASLALGTTAQDIAAPLTTGDFLLALNFPETAEDRDGFRALRMALQDRTASKLIRSAQDVLTLLSQDGIYMDDLSPDRARPEIWRRFASGERGESVSALGGVRDRSCLALTAGRMRQDPVFRDAVHHFLRQFDQTLAGFEPTATDEEISKLAETRTARAFMLLGRVTGSFD